VWEGGGHAEEKVLTAQEYCESQAYCKVLFDRKVDVLEGLEVTLLSSSRNGAVREGEEMQWAVQNPVYLDSLIPRPCVLGTCLVRKQALALCFEVELPNSVCVRKDKMKTREGEGEITSRVLANVILPEEQKHAANASVICYLESLSCRASRCARRKMRCYG
jgi:hypothetical protein